MKSAFEDEVLFSGRQAGQVRERDRGGDVKVVRAGGLDRDNQVRGNSRRQRSRCAAGGDDDVYLPWYLSAHARTLQHHGWSHPSQVWSTYSGRPELENAAGRFHGSVAVTTELLDRIGGTWIQTKRADFDQQFIAALAVIGPPGDPAAHDLPAYVFRWSETGASHCQGYMTSPDNEDWYDRYRPSVTEPIIDFQPRFDESTNALIAELSKRRALATLTD